MQREAGEEARLLSNRTRDGSPARLSSYLKRIHRVYGLTPGQYLALRREQDGRCPVCHQKFWWRALRVDHDHLTGRVRGLLCNDCNYYVVGALEHAAESVLELSEDPFALEHVELDQLIQGSVYLKSTRPAEVVEV